MAAPCIAKTFLQASTNPSRFLLRRFCATAENVVKSDMNVKPVKEPIITRIVNHFKRLVEDYKNAVIETGSVIKEKPIRVALYSALTASAGYLYAHNPSMANYEGHLAMITCDQAEVGNTIRNTEKCQQIQSILEHHCHGRLRRFTFGLFSVIWVSEYPKYIDLYEAQCKDVQMTWGEWPKYIVDIGILDHWRWTEQYMVDFDINPLEWDHSSASNSKDEKVEK